MNGWRAFSGVSVFGAGLLAGLASVWARHDDAPAPAPVTQTERPPIRVEMEVPDTFDHAPSAFRVVRK